MLQPNCSQTVQMASCHLSMQWAQDGEGVLRIAVGSSAGHPDPVQRGVSQALGKSVE